MTDLHGENPTMQDMEVVDEPEVVRRRDGGGLVRAAFGGHVPGPRLDHDVRSRCCSTPAPTSHRGDDGS